jgi:hypothetical protein
MQVQDAYKLLYQGILGLEHLMSTHQEFTRHLQLEFDSISPDASQHLLEPVRADSTLFRLNLSAYKSLHQTAVPLVPLFLSTSEMKAGTKANLKETWVNFTNLCDRGALSGFQILLVQQFSSWLEQVDYPAVHHSEVYCSEYHPSYRLISAQFIPLIGKNNAV